MNLNPYIYDFLSSLFEDLELSKKIKEITLFGSVAKSTHDKDSDIDLFINPKNQKDTKDIENSIKKIKKSFEIIAEKKWHPKGVDLPINIIVGDIGSPTWKNIKEEIISSGIALYSSYKELPSDTQHFALVTFSLEKLDRKDKMKLIRNLYGYSLKKGKKEYIQQGIIDKMGGKKLSSNTILIPVAEIHIIRKLLNKFKVKHEIRETWIRS